MILSGRMFKRRLLNRSTDVEQTNQVALVSLFFVPSICTCVNRLFKHQF